VNLETIAERAGVSHTAVSLALRGEPGVGEATRKRIRKLAKELGYSPHGAASALASGRTGMVGIIPGLAPSAYISTWDQLMLNGLIEVFRTEKMGFVLLPDTSDAVVPSMIARRLVDAAAFFMMPHERVLKRSLAQAIPSVTINMSTEQEVDRVLPDDAQGVRAAMSHLMGLGHRRIVFVDTWEARSIHQPSRLTRRQTYLEAMRDAGLPVPGVIEGELSIPDRMNALRAGTSPTAYVCYSDHIAMQVIQYLWERGTRVPEQASVIGIDDIYESRYFIPPLTTIRVPFHELGVMAARMLLSRMDEPERPCETIWLPEELVIRGSTARLERA